MDWTLVHLVQGVASILFAKLVRSAITGELGARLGLRFQGDSNQDNQPQGCWPNFGIFGFSYFYRNDLHDLEFETKMGETQAKPGKGKPFNHYYGSFSFEMTDARRVSATKQRQSVAKKPVCLLTGSGFLLDECNQKYKEPQWSNAIEWN